MIGRVDTCVAMLQPASAIATPSEKVATDVAMGGAMSAMVIRIW